MILMEFLLAPTVPSEPRPKNMQRTVSSGSMREGRIVRQAGVRDVVVDADREVVLGLRLVPSRRSTALTMAGVNSLEDRP